MTGFRPIRSLEPEANNNQRVFGCRQKLTASRGFLVIARLLFNLGVVIIVWSLSRMFLCLGKKSAATVSQGSWSMNLVMSL